MIDNCSTFVEWFKDVPGVNGNVPRIMLDLLFDSTTNISSFDSNRYFPLDHLDGPFAQKFQDEDGVWHNFFFTSELHFGFGYYGGEVFSFRGDDDIWVFIVRAPSMQTLSLTFLSVLFDWQTRA